MGSFGRRKMGIWLLWGIVVVYEFLGMIGKLLTKRALPI
jgi:hypothetical protein